LFLFTFQSYGEIGFEGMGKLGGGRRKEERGKRKEVGGKRKEEASNLLAQTSYLLDFSD